MGEWPQDAIVRYHARLIRAVHDAVERTNAMKVMARLGVAFLDMKG